MGRAFKSTSGTTQLSARLFALAEMEHRTAVFDRAAELMADPAVAAAGWHVEAGSDFPGTSLPVSRTHYPVAGGGGLEGAAALHMATSAGDCFKACAEIEACAAWTYVSQAPLCVLKADITPGAAPSPRPFAISGVKSGASYTALQAARLKARLKVMQLAKNEDLDHIVPPALHAPF